MGSRRLPRAGRRAVLHLSSAVILALPGAKASAGVPASVADTLTADTLAACQDFFEYVHQHYQYVMDGGWGKRSSSPGLQGSDSIMQAVVSRVEAIPLRFLDEARRTAATTSDATVRVLGYFYNSCLVDTTGAAQGDVGSQKRADVCSKTTRERLGGALDELYIKQIAPPAAKAAVRAMVDTLRATVVTWIGRLSWLDSATQKREQAKVAQLDFELNLPDTWPDYTTFQLTPTDFAANQAAVADAPRLPGIMFANFGAQTPYGTASGVNPGVVAPPLFDAADLASSYGAAGSIIAHELMHNFHGLHSAFTSGDSIVYNRRMQPFNAPYAAAEQAGEMKHFESVGEHFANGVGLFVAYQAFERAARAKPARSIHGVTPEQRFFIMFANSMAYLYQAVPGRLVGDATDARARVNIAVSSMQAFAKAFGCKAGDAMVGAPEQQVERIP